MKPSERYPLHLQNKSTERKIPDEETLRRERIRKKIDFIGQLRQLGDELSEVWED